MNKTYAEGKLSLQMLQKFVWTTNVQKLTEANLRNDSAKFATGGRDTVSGWTISGWEYLSGYDKGGNIGTKVLEEVCKAIEEYKSLGIVCSTSKFVESKAWINTSSKNEATNILGDAYP